MVTAPQNPVIQNLVDAIKLALQECKTMPHSEQWHLYRLAARFAKQLSAVILSDDT